MKINVWHSIEQRTLLMHPLTSGIHDSKHAYVPKTKILNTWRKFICVEKNEEIASFVNISHS